MSDSLISGAKSGGKPLLAIATEQGSVHILDTTKRRDWDYGMLFPVSLPSSLMNLPRTTTYDSPTARQRNLRPQMEPIRHPHSLGLRRLNNKDILPYYPTVPLYPRRPQ